MIISRTPFRISFFGGGTDYPVWYREHGGAVINATINKYCFVTLRYLPPFFDYKHRIRYYQREEVKEIDEIRHPSVRECLKFVGTRDGVDIVHHADLPAQSGLGSSSTFTVGLLHALYTLKHYMPTKRELALNAINVEQNWIGENVGSQDQTAAAFGGLNYVCFGGASEIDVKPLVLSPERLEQLNDSMLLFFTGFPRNASNVAGEQVARLRDRKIDLHDMMQLTEAAMQELLYGGEGMAEIGRLLNEQWKIKRSLTDRISSDAIDEIYSRGIAAGATGGKLLGAGGGGFIMFLAGRESREQVKHALQELLYVPVRFEFSGSQIIYYSHYD